MKRQKVLIFIVSYHAENFIQSVLARIPQEVLENEQYETEVLVIDDESPDETFLRAIEFQHLHPDFKLTILRNAQNQGYGGNQKLGYHYAIKHNYDVVILLHGDGQYAPEWIPQMIAPILNDEAEVVLGSRMINKREALHGGMPFYKWVGNQLLTWLQNLILGAELSEFHSGYRAYKVSSLAAIPFQANSNYFDFDTDIIIQMLDTGQRITEISIPTYYGDEISRVNGIRYGMLILKTSLLSRFVPRGIFYNPKFDYVADGTQYTPKLGFFSSHEFALQRVKSGATILDIGCGPGFMAEALALKKGKLISLDLHIHPKTAQYSDIVREVDVEHYDFQEEFGKVDMILLLDIIEHLRQPEILFARLRQRFGQNAPSFIITTGNIGFFVIRLGLLLGQFNYGKRGILDMDHTRLFTFQSLQRVLVNTGYELLEVKGIPAPFPLAIGDHWFSHFLLAVNQFLMLFSKGLFAYQIAIVAKPLPTLDHLLNDAYQASQQHLDNNFGKLINE